MTKEIIEREHIICTRCKGGGDSKWWEIDDWCHLCDGKGTVIIKERKIIDESNPSNTIED